MRESGKDRLIILDFGGGKYMFKYFAEGNKLLFFSKVFPRKTALVAGYNSFINLLDAPVEYSKRADNPKHLIYRKKDHYYFTVINLRGTTVGRSESFKTEEDCIQAIYHLYDNAKKAEIKYLEGDAV